MGTSAYLRCFVTGKDKPDEVSSDVWVVTWPDVPLTVEVSGGFPEGRFKEWIGPSVRRYQPHARYILVRRTNNWVVETGIVIRREQMDGG